MSKVDFLKKWRNDRDFKFDMMRKGIRVIQDNVIFFNENGSVRAVAGNYVKQFPPHKGKENKKSFKKLLTNKTEYGKIKM